MSTTHARERAENDSNGEYHPDMPDRESGSERLGMRETLLVLFYDPAVRNYTIAVFSALAMIFLVLFEQNSDIGGVIVVLLGAAGVLFRWVAAPPLILIVLTYFLYCPFGIPEVPSNRRWDLHERRFALLDIIFVMSVLVYVVSHYRIMSFVHQAIAADGPANRRDAPSLRRPPALIAPAELGMLLGYSLVFVLIGQLVWWFVTSVEVVPTDDFLIRWVGSERFMRSTEPVGVAPPRTTIFFVVVGMVFFGTLLGRVVFRYWRLRVMGAAEAELVLLDGGWDETKRERSRVEKWRIWGKKRAEARSKSQADEEEIAAARERAEKSRAERRRQEQAERRGGRTQRSRNRGMR